MHAPWTVPSHRSIEELVSGFGAGSSPWRLGRLIAGTTMAVKPPQTDVSDLVTMIADLASLVAADSTRLQHSADELTGLYRISSAERSSTIVPALQSTFRVLIEIALRIREEARSLQKLETAGPGKPPS